MLFGALGIIPTLGRADKIACNAPNALKRYRFKRVAHINVLAINGEIKRLQIPALVTDVDVGDVCLYLGLIHLAAMDRDGYVAYLHGAPPQ